jgi:Ribonuclease G/E
MKGRVIALDLWRGRKAAALLVDGRLHDLLVDPPDQGPPRPGTIFRALADRPMKGLGGLTVKLPGDARGFLRDGKGVRPGAALLVQVSGFAEPGKAVPVSARILLKGQYAIATPGAPGLNVSRQIRDPDTRERLVQIARGACPEDMGLILRSAAEGSQASDIEEDIVRQIAISQDLAGQASGEGPACLYDGPDAHAIARRDWTDGTGGPPGSDRFSDHGVEEMIGAMLDPGLALPGGGSAWIEPTRALVAVDVNTGPDTSAAAGLKANIELARDLPRQMRCRGLGGQITIDMAPMAKAARRQVENALRTAFRADPVETALVGWTPLGHFELQRKRERFPLSQ